MSDNKKTVLSDHKRYKTRLIPPLLAMMGNRSKTYSWAKEIAPELLWIGILQSEMGEVDGANFAIELAMAADMNCSHSSKPHFAKITSFQFLSDDEKIAVVTQMSRMPLYAEAMNALNILYKLLPDSPLAFLRSEENTQSDVEAKNKIHELLPKLYDRHSRETVLCIATGVMISLRQGMLSVSEEVAKKLYNDFEVIDQYPDTAVSRTAGSSFRALSPMFYFSEGEEPEQCTIEWLEKFWKQVGVFGKCDIPAKLGLAEEEPEDELGRIITRFRNSARIEFYSRLNAWKFDLNEIEQYEVIGALLARQVSLVNDLAGSPRIWTDHSAPLILRAMADVYIHLAWIFGSRQERAKKFIQDGLGSIKLEVAHKKADLENNGDPDGQLSRNIEFLESWIASQRLDDLVEVNLGSWSGLSTRAMAQEANCLDFYNYVYQPFSNAAHSSWSHVSIHNSSYCLNPTHRIHRVAISENHDPDLNWLVLGAKYLNKSFKQYDEKITITVDCQSAYEQLLDDLEKSYPQETSEDS